MALFGVQYFTGKNVDFFWLFKRQFRSEKVK